MARPDPVRVVPEQRDAAVVPVMLRIGQLRAYRIGSVSFYATGAEVQRALADLLRAVADEIDAHLDAAGDPAGDADQAGRS